MLDINLIRKDKKIVMKAIKDRNKKFDMDYFIDLDNKKRRLQLKVDELRAKKNQASDKIAKLSDLEKQQAILDIKGTSERLKDLESKLAIMEKEWKTMLLKFPNIPLSDVPVGKDESENKPIRQIGKPTKFDFKPKDHLDLGEKLDIIDVKTAGKISGTRFNYLKSEAVLLEFAIIQHTIKTLTDPKILKEIADSIKPGYSATPFIPIIPPVMIRPEIFEKMARLEPQEERYYIPSDKVFLIGSAEHTLGPMHIDKVLQAKNLPLRYLGFSTSFRREAGSYGKDTKGILRVHQFDKLEMESFSISENSKIEQDFFVAIQEYLVKSLKLPYQVVQICTGDMGDPDARQIDIECWLPSENKYRETHTSDLMTDYQARRLNTRYQNEKGEYKYVHTNDATAFAIGRILIAIMENNQQKDGSIKIPEVLWGYCGIKEIKR